MQISGLVSGSVPNNSFSGVQSFKFNPKDMQEKMRAQTREAKLREQEDEMIKKLQKQISSVGNSDISQDTKDAQIENLSAQIQSIYGNRTEREKQAREAELQKQKAEAEEVKRKQEEASEKRKPAKPSDEDAIVKEDMEGMVKLAVSHDGINALKKTKAGLAAEASRLPNEIENDAKVKATQIANDAGLKGNYTQEMLDYALKGEYDRSTFKNRHLEDLNNSIANLETAINTEIGEINKEVNDMLEAKNEAANETGKEEKPEETENIENAQNAETENASKNENAQNAETKNASKNENALNAENAS